jgi:hypothetical protein
MDLFEARIQVCLRKFIDQTLFDGFRNGPMDPCSMGLFEASYGKVILEMRPFAMGLFPKFIN